MVLLSLKPDPKDSVLKSCMHLLEMDSLPRSIGCHLMFQCRDPGKNGGNLQVQMLGSTSRVPRKAWNWCRVDLNFLERNQKWKNWFCHCYNRIRKRTAHESLMKEWKLNDPCVLSLSKSGITSPSRTIPLLQCRNIGSLPRWNQHAQLTAMLEVQGHRCTQQPPVFFVFGLNLFRFILLIKLTALCSNIEIAHAHRDNIALYKLLDLHIFN